MSVEGLVTSQRYTVTPQPIEHLLAWVRSGEIAIPEIQRPFVWEATKVRDLLDSLYRGFPVGYLITWRNPTIRLKDGTLAAGKRILIDGQQRVTALMAALLGQRVLTKDYETVHIRIAFHPVEERFEVANPAIRKDSAWIHDITEIFSPDASLIEAIDDYAERNPGTNRKHVSRVLEKLRKILNNHVGIIELSESLDIETVTEIFIRVNSAGVTLSQADFAMSKIAANEQYGGSQLRKAIDYFCHLAVAPEFFTKLEQSDRGFAESDYFARLRWLKNGNDDIYDPTYTDMLRVAFTSEFRRGRLQELVALLSGRNFETRQYEEEIAERSFAELKRGILNFMSQTHFERFLMIMRSAGFISSDLIGGRNAVNFAYIIYLRGRAEKTDAALLERLVRRWYVMSVLRSRYSGSPETAFDVDIRQIESQGLRAYCDAIIASELPDSFWGGLLPQLMDTSATTSPYFMSFRAAQVNLNDKAFLSRDITVRDLIVNRGDVHHIYPRNWLKKQGLSRGRYNQIANFVLAQSEINIAIGDRPPQQYVAELAAQCEGGPSRFGGITDLDQLRENFRQNAMPIAMVGGDVPSYDEFLQERRRLMSRRIETWFKGL